MIREEYERLKNNDKKSLKEIEGIKLMGERAYYSTTVKKLSALIKGIGFNTIFTFFIGIGLFLLLVFGVIANPNYLTNLYVILGLVLTSAVNVWTIVWFLFVKRNMKKKVEKYKAIIKKMNEDELEKKKAIYNVYKKEA